MTNGNKTKVPQFFYGTAWKQDRTEDLTYLALKSGFTAIDTANQRKHYYEEGVGRGVQRFLATTDSRREDLFLQTKFTFARGQDHRKPYKESDSYAKQVQDSFASSLEHLGTSYIDSLILHGPFSNQGIVEEDLQARHAMQDLLQAQKVGAIGISNVSAEQLLQLCDVVDDKPQYVQNRCFARMGWDKEVREICKSQGIAYQGFSLLTANTHELASPVIYPMTEEYGKTTAQIIFRFCQQVGMICLTGTSNENHMKQDLDIQDFQLSSQEIEQIESIAF